jgi:hypothetical protein
MDAGILVNQQEVPLCALFIPEGSSGVPSVQLLVVGVRGVVLRQLRGLLSKVSVI